MSLKELSNRHEAIIRRLVTGQPDWEICLEVNISGHYLSNLKRDPLFADRLEQQAQNADRLFLEKLGDAKVILEHLKVPAALKMREIINDGQVGGRMIKPDKQADMVAKMLNIGGPVLPGGGDIHFHLTEAVVEAYMRKYKRGDGSEAEEPVQITEDDSNEVIDV